MCDTGPGELERLRHEVSVARKAMADFPNYIDDWGWLASHLEFVDIFRPDLSDWIRREDVPEDG